MTSGAGPRLDRAPLVALALVALLVALWAGLVRIGWALPGAASAPLLAHGPLMVSGFLGTLIGMERAVALGVRAGYAVPLLTALGVPVVLAAPGSALGPLLITAGSAGLVAVLAAMARRGTVRVMAIMGAGAGCWMAGNVVWWAGGSPTRATGWWAAFPVLTIVAERLELGRLTGVSRSGRRWLQGAVATMLAGLGVGLVGALLAGPTPTAATAGARATGEAAGGNAVLQAVSWSTLGVRLTGVAALGMCLWLLRHDVGLRRLGAPGLPRFAAVNLAGACVWLGVGGGVLLAAAPLDNGVGYDAAYHAIFLGFTFGMIFAHAPIVFPAVLGVDVPFRGWFYGHVALLHGSLVLRLVGDAGLWPPGRPWGGMLNAAALLAFFAATVASALLGGIARGRDPGARRSPGRPVA